MAQIIAPETLSGISFSAVLPLMSFLAVAALGEMLVVMTGGIDLSIPGVITLAGIVVVGSADGANDKLAVAILICLGWSALIGLVNGVLVAVAGLNPLIVTLAVGQIVLGIANERHDQIVVESAVPPALSDWAQHKVLGISLLFWTGLAITLLLAVCLRFTIIGRRFQAVGANSRRGLARGDQGPASHRVRLCLRRRALRHGGHHAGRLHEEPRARTRRPVPPGADRGRRDRRRLARRRTRKRDFDWMAAFALTLLAQLLRVRGLSTNLQFVVFGAAIAAGMVISGDRVVAVLGRVVSRPRVQAFLGTGGDSPGTDERREKSTEPREEKARDADPSITVSLRSARR